MFFKKKPSTLALTLAGATVAVLAANPAFAGGLSSGSSAASTFYTWMYSILGIMAGCYLLYKGMMAWTDKEHWSDFGAGVVKVAVVGAVSILAPFAWGLFTN